MTTTTSESNPSEPAASPRPGAFLSPGDGSDTERDVHVATQSPSRGGKADAAAPYLVRVLMPPMIFIIGIGLLVAFFLGSASASVAGINTWIPIGVLGLLFVAGVFVFFARRKGAYKPVEGSPGTPALESDARYRLRLVVPKAMAGALGPLSDQPFEPRVFRLYFALPRRSAPAVVAIVVMSILAVSALFFLKRYVPWGTGGRRPEPFEYWGAVGLAMAPFAVLWPTYLRVSPARLDVFQYPFMAVGPARVTTFDLRSARVLLDMNQRRLRIDPAEGPPVSIGLGYLASSADLPRAVFEAARWRHEAPAPPTDALAG